MQPSPARTSLSLAARTAGVLLAGLAVAEFAAFSFPDRNSYRLLLALLAVGGLLLLGWLHPRAAVLGGFAFLIVIALLRRLLIPIAGWSSWDPLLVVGPTVAAFLVLRIIFASGGRSLTPDRLSWLVMALLVLTGLQAVNPANGSVIAGLTGLLFAAVPLLWFLVGRNLGDRRTAGLMVAGLVPLGTAEALYGFWQAHLGLPPWDGQWFVLNGYDALRVADALRPFGSFSSSAEYAAVLAMTASAAIAYALHGRLAALAVLPLPLWALIEGSIRGAVILTVAAVIIMTAIRARNGTAGGALAVAGVAATAGLGLLFGNALEHVAAQTGNPLIVHTVSGLVHPYDSPASTLSEHQDLVAGGLLLSFQHPLGYGSGYMSGDKFSGPAVQTEVDLSNEFVALGPLGGLIFTAIVVAGLTQTIRLYRRRSDPLLLAVVGLLVADLGQWLNGGFYAVAAIVWFLIGWIAREAAEPQAVPEPAPTPRITQRRALVMVPRGGGSTGSP